MLRFAARVGIIGVNPYVVPPDEVLEALFRAAGRDRGPIPVRGKLEGHPFQQTLVRYRGAWRLYLNGPMRTAAEVDVGDNARVDLEFDARPPTYAIPPALRTALSRNPKAKAAFAALAPSRRKEIQRYLGSLKAQATVNANVDRVVRHLVGQGPKELSALMRRPRPVRARTKQAAGVD